MHLCNLEIACRLWFLLNILKFFEVMTGFYKDISETNVIYYEARKGFRNDNILR